MNIELSLLELNDLYYVVSKGVEKHKEYVEIAKRTTPELKGYFDEELDKSIQLLNKIQTALHNEANRIDDVIDEVKTERDYSAFKDYADSMNDAQAEDRRLDNI
jgi:predicted DNA-binding ArsR family transcriptional regulator